MTVCITNDEITIYPDGRLDTKNASRYIGLAEKTMAMMRCKGNGPKFIKRGRIFYFREDLDTWLNAAGRFTSTSQAQQRALLMSRMRRPVNEEFHDL